MLGKELACDWRCNGWHLDSDLLNACGWVGIAQLAISWLPDSWLMVVSLIPGRSGENFLLAVTLLCWLLLSACSTATLKQLIKDPSYSAKSAGGRLHLNMRTPWLNKVGVGWLCFPGIVCKPLREMSSHATCQGTLGQLFQLAEPL